MESHMGNTSIYELESINGDIPLFGIYQNGEWLAIECTLGVYKDGIVLVDIDSKEKLH